MQGQESVGRPEGTADDADDACRQHRGVEQKWITLRNEKPAPVDS
jgi:hypothetical protein